MSESDERGPSRPTRDAEYLRRVFSLPVQLDCVLDRVSISSSTVLEPEQFVELNVESPCYVDLVADGLTVGRGELVQLDDHIGLHILALSEEVEHGSH